MPLSSSIHQTHTILGGSGFRYETVELVLASIPHFELKQKGRILHLFAEIYNTFMQEIQEALDERQNNIDSLTGYERVNQLRAEPFAFESQVETDSQPVDLSVRSLDESFQLANELDNLSPNESFPVLASTEKRRQLQQSVNSDNHVNDRTKDESIIVKKEAITPSKTKTHKSKTSTVTKRKNRSTNSTMRQITMTQLFEPVESSKTSLNQTTMKDEPHTLNDDTISNMPESLIGLAERSLSPFSAEDEDDQENPISNITLPIRAIRTGNGQSQKRKSIPSQSTSEELPEQTAEEDEEENFQNQAILQTPYSAVENEELLYACPMCRNYWLGLPPQLRQRQGLKCRHRQRPAVRTPEHFWSLGIPNTQTCIERGYGGVLPPEKPIERPRRPRRQHQRILKEKQQSVYNNKSNNDEDSN